MTTTTETVTAVRRNPKDSMKSTWQSGDKSQWTIWHWFIEILDVHPFDLTTPVPVFAKTDKIPNASTWDTHKRIFAYASVPVLIHYVYVQYTGHNLTFAWAALLYGTWIKFTGVREIRTIRKLGHIYGYLDGDKHGRDGVPDVRVREVVTSLVLTSTTRTLMLVMA
jgi:hypothetical protein